jgi:hypothetical protein
MHCTVCPYFHTVEDTNSSEVYDVCTVDDDWFIIEPPYNCKRPESLRSSFYSESKEFIRAKTSRD